MHLPLQALSSELQANQKRLAFYQAQLDQYLAQAALQNPRKTPQPPATLAKWVELYAERVRKLERQLQKQGLRTELSALKHASESSASRAKSSAKKKASRRAS